MLADAENKNICTIFGYNVSLQMFYLYWIFVCMCYILMFHVVFGVQVQVSRFCLDVILERSQHSKKRSQALLDMNRRKRNPVSIFFAKSLKAQC